MNTKYNAYNGDHSLKEKLLIEVEKHRVADQLVKGTYGENEYEFRGCAVACSIHSLNIINGTNIKLSSHRDLAAALNIPIALFRLQDGIFEGLPQAEAMTWPGRFYEAVKVGANLEMVWPKFALWLIGDSEKGIIRYAKTELSKKAITDVAALYQRWIEGEKADMKEWRAAAYAAAYAAADASADAAYAAAYAAADASADADYDAADAADAAADAAAYTAYTAYAAYAYTYADADADASSAAYASSAYAYAASAYAYAYASARAAASADAAAGAARKQARINQGEELLRLMTLEPGI